MLLNEEGQMPINKNRGILINFFSIIYGTNILNNVIV